MAQFPSMKAAALKRLLERGPLSYEVVRQNGSHCQMRAPGRPALTFAYHDGVTVPPGMVKKILCKDVGLSEDEALALVN